MEPQTTPCPVQTQSLLTRAWWPLTAVVIAACSGDLGEHPEPSEGASAPSQPTVGGGLDPGGNQPPAEPPPVSDSLVPGGALRRLPARSLNATLDGLFPELRDQRPGFPPDVYDLFDTDIKALDGGLAFLESGALVIKDLVKLARANAAVWSRVKTCANPSDTATCLGQMYDAWAPKLLRRPGNAEERNRFLALASVDLGETDDALAVALETLLRHPEFVYQVELGVGTGERRYLAHHEVQNRLAYLLWGEAPDEALRARAGDLFDSATRVELANEMLKDPRAIRQLQDYHAQWVGYATMGQAGLGADMLKESAALVERVIQGGLPYQQLFLSEETFVTPELAAHYGLPKLETAGWVSTAGSGRLGILGHGAFLQAFSNVADTSPAKRGKHVMRRFLCTSLEVPPNMLVDVDAMPKDGQCRTDFFKAEHAVGSCAGCHQILDGIGFALDIFDKTGQQRTHEPNKPDCALDGKGELAGTQIQGADGLARALASQPGLSSCIAGQLTHFVMGRDPSETPEGQALAKSLATTFETNGGRFAALLTDFVARPEFAQVAPR